MPFDESQPEHKLTVPELVDALASDGMIDAAQAATLRERVGLHSRLDIHPLVVLANQKLNSRREGGDLDLESLVQWLARHVGLGAYRIDPLKIDVSAVTAVVSHAYAQRFKILPVEAHPERVVIACSEPYARQWARELESILKRKVERVIANPVELTRYIGEFYGLSSSIRRASRENEGARIAGLSDLEQLVELGRQGKLDANDRHVVSIVDWLLQYAFEQRASDIHVEPRRGEGNIRFRIDGVMHHVYRMPATIMTAVTSRLKILGRMDVAEKRRPQDGRIKSKTPKGEEIELRLSTMPTAFGEKLVMRIFNPEVLMKGLGELGFGEREREAWNGLLGQGHGIILVTGPTGSGKTTTLYSSLKHLATDEVNVCTVEDPIENIVPDFNQMQTQHNIGLDFASGVRTLMRQDPDIIMIGEIRDTETADMAVQAALTGHLVLSTLHTNDAPSAITRLMDIGVPPYLIKGSLLGILAQRLVRTLCPHCRQESKVDGDEWRELTRPFRVTPPKRVYLPNGCPECRDTGYLGRVGIYELLLLDDELRRLIVNDLDLVAFRELARRRGMHPLRIDGARKVAEGLTTVEEVLRVAPATGEL